MITTFSALMAMIASVLFPLRLLACASSSSKEKFETLVRVLPYLYTTLDIERQTPENKVGDVQKMASEW
jgi:hypothetical protein